MLPACLPAKWPNTPGGRLQLCATERIHRRNSGGRSNFLTFLCKYISLCFKGKTWRPWCRHPGCRSARWWSAQLCVGLCGQSWPRLSQYAAQIPLPVRFIHHSIIYLRNPKISSFNPSPLLNTTLPHCFELLVRAICGLLPTRASQDLMHIPSMKSCKQKSLPTLIHSSPTIWSSPVPTLFPVVQSNAPLPFFGSHHSSPTSSDRRPCPCFPGLLVGGLVSVGSVLWTLVFVILLACHLSLVYRLHHEMLPSSC